MRSLTWIGIIALSSANFIGCAEGGADTGESSGAGAGGGTAQGGGGNTSSSGGAGGSGTSSGGAGGGTGGGGGVAGGLIYTGTILNGFDQMPIPQADVCSIEPVLPCVTSDTTGTFIYNGVPENTRVRVGASKEQFFPIESLIDTTDVNGSLTAFMLSRGIITLGLNSVNVTWDDALPAISVTVRNLANQPLAGYAVALSANVGDGPYYIDGTSIVQNATVTQSTGTAFFVNVPIGTYDVSVSGPTSCEASFINDDPNVHVAPLINAAQFVVIFDCQ